MASAIANRSVPLTGVRRETSKRRGSPSFSNAHPDPAKRAHKFSALSVADAIEQYADERRPDGEIRRSMRPASTPGANCTDAPSHSAAARDHFLFPWHGQQAPGPDASHDVVAHGLAIPPERRRSPHVRFHDGRHTALTRLAEKGLPVSVIRARFGHVSPTMMAIYSHVRGRHSMTRRRPSSPRRPLPCHPFPDRPERPVEDEGVTSHVTSQLPPARSNVVDFPKESGAPCKTRTCDLLVRSRIRGVSYRDTSRQLEQYRRARTRQRCGVGVIPNHTVSDRDGAQNAAQNRLTTLRLTPCDFTRVGERLDTR
jgi:hypothetical protein